MIGPSALDILRYTRRIRYFGVPGLTLEVLCDLQESHLLSVPFENLDIHAGRRITLDASALFEKIVLRNRGGFCYELNGLFSLLLKKIGFDVRLLMGRVYDRNRNAYGPEFDHMLILAKVEGENWLVDVGFGDFALHPLRFALDQPLPDRNGKFIIEHYDGEYYRVSRFLEEANEFSPEYLFSLRECNLSDFSDMCLYHQTSPDSHFTSQRLCSIATPTGRITLTDRKLIVTERRVRSEVSICSESAFSEALTQYFRIVLQG